MISDLVLKPRVLRDCSVSPSEGSNCTRHSSLKELFLLKLKRLRSKMKAKCAYSGVFECGMEEVETRL